MAIYESKRNIPWWVYGCGFIILIILILMALPIIPVKEEYSLQEQENVSVPLTTAKSINETIEKENETRVTLPMDYELVNTSRMYSANEGDYEDSENINGEALQNFTLSFTKNISTCIPYNYVFYRDDVSVNSAEEEICFENSSREKFTFTEIYTGEIEDYHYNITIEDVPTVEKNITKTYNISHSEIKNVSINKSVVISKNITKVRRVNKSMFNLIFS